MRDLIGRYREAFHAALGLEAMDVVPALGEALREAWRTGRTIYLCGNGGSAGNANHLANDFLYGAGVTHGVGLKVESLSANPAVLTCLANDIGYENVYSEQLRVKGERRRRADRALRQRQLAERREGAGDRRAPRA